MGSVFVESGDEPHEARNLTDQPATVYATFLAPDADPGASIVSASAARIVESWPSCSAAVNWEAQFATSSRSRLR